MLQLHKQLSRCEVLKDALKVLRDIENICNLVTCYFTYHWCRNLSQMNLFPSRRRPFLSSKGLRAVLSPSLTSLFAQNLRRCGVDDNSGGKGFVHSPAEFSCGLMRARKTWKGLKEREGWSRTKTLVIFLRAIVKCYLLDLHLISTNGTGSPSLHSKQ